MGSPASTDIRLRADRQPAHRRPRPLAATFVTFGVLTGAYLVYAATVSPWLVPGAVQHSRQQPPALSPLSPPRNGVAMAERWLASQPWAADDDGYMLRTDDASTGEWATFVYFEKWEPTDEDEAARFKPFAMIWRPAGHPADAAPYTIEAESAYVRFASKFDLADANAGRVIGGALEGPVAIHGPDGLVVHGRDDFTFSEDAMRIWTAGPVRILYGPHRATAVGFQADLIPERSARERNNLAASGVRSVRLLRNVALDLEFAGSGDDPAGELPRVERPGSEPPRREKPPRPVAIRSVGSLEYQVDQHTAIVEGNVRVDAPDPEQPDQFDRLRCDTLTLLFEPKPEDGEPHAAGVTSARTEAGVPAGTSEETGNAPGGSSLAFRRLIADGPHVVLTSDKNDLQAIATRVIYDGRTRVAQLTDPRPVHVVQGTSELHSPEITLLHDEDGEITSAWCAGPGWLTARDQRTGAVSFDARWQTMLRKYPDPRVPLDVIELEDRAIVHQPAEQVGLAAGFIRMWVEPDEQSRPPAPRDAQSADPPKDDAGDNDGYRPRRMLALGQVALVSPQLEAAAPRLEVRFDDLPPTHAEPGGASGSTVQSRPESGKTRFTRTASLTAHDARQGGNGSAAGSSRGTRLPPTSGGSPSELGGEFRTESQDGPVHVTADLIRVQVLLVPKPASQAAGRSGLPATDAGDGRDYDPYVSQVWTEGNVQVWQAHATGEPPLTITGERAEIQNRAADDQVLHVFGQPAHIRERGLHIEGRAIHFDRAANVASVEGAGMLQLPVRQDLEGRRLAEPKLLDVWWHEQMTFDGLAAKFFGQVKAVLDDSSMRSEEMEVLLKERISFRDDLDRPRAAHPDDPRRDDVEIDRVICRDGVEFDSYVYTDSKLTEIRRGHVARFELNQQTGTSEARGPGWIRFWRRGRGKRAAMTPTALVQANQPLEPDGSEWEFTRIDFSGVAAGNVRERLMTFHDRVRILYGPVDRPLVTIELDELPRDAGWMSSDSLQITQHEVADRGRHDEDGPVSYIELQAVGNAELEGRSFNAQADVISYDESKGLYILRSDGNRTATIWHQEQPGATPRVGTAQRIEFIPARNHLRGLRTTGLSGVQ